MDFRRGRKYGSVTMSDNNTSEMKRALGLYRDIPTETWTVVLSLEVPKGLADGSSPWTEEQHVYSAIKHSFNEGHRLNMSGESHWPWEMLELEKREGNSHDRTETE